MTIDEQLAENMRKSFEAGLSSRLRRASQAKLQRVIPAHWFASAASECAGMYIAGYFYGAISIAQAYVEALSGFLSNFHPVGAKNDPDKRWNLLYEKRVISVEVRDAALDIFSDRNDFHHLNRQVEQDFAKLEERALICLNHLHTIEAEVFSYSFDNGSIVLEKPELWPSVGDGLSNINLRKLW